MIFTARANREGRLHMTDYSKALLKKFASENPGMPFEIKPRLPESSKQRGYFEGCLIPLYMYFQENLDHHDSSQHETAREQVKNAFNADLSLNPITHSLEKIARSTKGRETLKRVSEELQEWLVDNYAPDADVMNPEHYKIWRDTVFPYGGPDNYIDYCAMKGLLKDRVT